MTLNQTYGSLIQALRELCLSHMAVKAFRVGEVSQIEVPTGNDGPNKNSFDYPYIHLVPVDAQLNGRSTIFTFEMIVMDLAKDSSDLTIRVQSTLLEVTRDLLSKFTQTTWSQYPFSLRLPTTTRPFVENYKNSVAGWTTTLVIEVQSPNNLCDFPEK